VLYNIAVLRVVSIVIITVIVTDSSFIPGLWLYLKYLKGSLSYTIYTQRSLLFIYQQIRTLFCCLDIDDHCLNLIFHYSLEACISLQLLKEN